MPGAEADKVAALAAELDDAADQIDDVDRLADSVPWRRATISDDTVNSCVATTGEFHFAVIS